MTPEEALTLKPGDRVMDIGYPDDPAVTRFGIVTNVANNGATIYAFWAHSIEGAEEEAKRYSDRSVARGLSVYCAEVVRWSKLAEKLLL